MKELTDQPTRILYVDDDLDACELVKVYLSEYDVEVVHSAVDARRMITSHSFDLYLLDNWLRDGSGIELCRQIRRVDPNAPVLFFSAVVREGAKDEAHAAGAQGYLIKPLELDELKRAVRMLLIKSLSKASEAKQTELSVITEELAARRRQLQTSFRDSAKESQGSAHKRLVIKARTAFLAAGGTRAQFERLWADEISKKLLVNEETVS